MNSPEHESTEADMHAVWSGGNAVKPLVRANSSSISDYLMNLDIIPPDDVRAEMDLDTRKLYDAAMNEPN